MDCKESNQSIQKKINPEYSLERLMLKLKLQYFGHLMCRTDSLEKTLMLGKTEDRRRRGNRGWDGWMASLAWWTWVWASSRSWWWTGSLVCSSPYGHKQLDTTEWLNWYYMGWRGNSEKTTYRLKIKQNKNLLDKVIIKL